MAPTASETSLSIGSPLALRNQYERDGYVFPLRVLNDDEAARYLAQYHAYVERNGARLAALPANQKYLVLSETHFAARWAYEIVTNPRILDAVEAVIGANILAWGTNWFSKMPGDKAYVSWHQDGTYWNLSPVKVVTAWLALTPSNEMNGGLRVVPGSHRQPMLPQRETYAPDNALSRGQEIAVEVDEAQAVCLSLHPGEMSLHHTWIVHGSKANTSSIPRIGLAIRYVSPEVKQESPGKPHALLVRGRDDYGNFELRNAPTNDDPDPAEHEAIVRHIRASIMLGAKK
jgi:ectoine hydroxylase-related dioxygenase (phytanoyl-CoA dioxygenase family)